jgi:uncharacterized membrane protein YhaH (DUF805 family)
MLGFLFGFNARIGRMNYFLATIGLAIVMTGLFFAIAAAVYQDTPRDMSVSFDKVALPVLAVAAMFILASLSLQCMRIRDIGWDPVCVMPIWLAIMAIDWLVASRFPAWAVGQGHFSTPVSGLINMGMTLALLFWPSAEYVVTPTSFDAPPRQPEQPPRRGGETPVASRIASVSSGEFGRRAR